MTGLVQAPSFRVNDFEGPLDLLFHLIEKNDMDIYDIQIAEITEQYMIFLYEMKALDMEIASEFLVMAATLIHIKSRMLLPGKTVLQTDEEEDPREELVMRLLQYRRCKVVAGELKGRFHSYSPSILRLPMTAKALDIKLTPPVQIFNADAFNEGITAVCNRNQLRFADISAKISHILQRDKTSVKEKMKWLWKKLAACKKIFFHEMFSAKNSSRIEKITGFLAVLELLRSNRIDARQDKPFDVILLEKKQEEAVADDQDGAVFLENVKEEALYDE